MKHMIKRFIVGVLAITLVIGNLSMTVVAEETQDGTFTAVSMNVDGLPQKILFFEINSDGPGSDGTKKISEKLSTYDWDIIGVSEDFNYNTELMSSLTNYNSGTYRGSVSGLSNDTDGLNLIWKNDISVAGESWVSWNDEYSSGLFGTGNGADGMIDKGYRFYQATVAEGVVVDVYILHMDADSDAEDIAAREKQLQQLVDAIKASDNGNPIIVMGDTNCRYTRESLQTIFIDGINADNRFTIQDAWIENVRDGVYPEKGADALLAIDKGGTYSYPQAEIVDKIFYINNTESDITLTANSYSIATDFTDTDGAALADHWPVVVEFDYAVQNEGTTDSVPDVCEHDYQVTGSIEATCTETGSTTYTCSKCFESYTEIVAVNGHVEIEDVGKSATCTESGLTEGSHCSVCGEAIVVQTVIPATGHNYVNGSCDICGETDPNYSESTPVDDMILGDQATEIVSGNSYVIAFSGSTGTFSLERDNSNIVANKLALVEGDVLTENLVWEITEYDNGYTISTEIDGKEFYLYRTARFTGFGYQLELQEDSYVWSLTMKDGFRFYSTSRLGSKYYLRYYNSNQGWIGTTRAASLTLYEVIK